MADLVKVLPSMKRILLGSLTILFLLALGAQAANVNIWPGHAPGETSLEKGTLQPNRKGEDPPIHRLVNVRCPSMDIFLAEDKGKPTPAVLVLPGGGFGKVVPNKEGSEVAPWLNPKGVSVFVLRYRTSEPVGPDEPKWKRPLQDTQRAMRLIRANATRWNIDPHRLGILGFSAGGQVAAIAHASPAHHSYDNIDKIDEQSAIPDFSLLIYPWQVLQNDQIHLLEAIRYDRKTTPAFIVHTHDDRSSSVGSLEIYRNLKLQGVPAELHIYHNGGHGYGMRAVKGSDIGTWPDRAGEWLDRTLPSLGGGTKK